MAAACARLGLRSAWISALPANAWGERIRRELTAHGVDCAHVRIDGRRPVGVYFLEYGAAPRPVRVLYDRRDSAFARLTRRGGRLGAGAAGPACAPDRDHAGAGPRAARLSSSGRCARRRQLSFDVNYRATLWSPAEARAFAESVLPAGALLLHRRGGGADRLRPDWLGRGHARGARPGSRRRRRSRSCRGRRARRCWTAGASGGRAGTHTVQMVDPVGAGDAYVAGFLWATLSGRGPQEAVDAGAAVAALKCSTWGDIALIDPARRRRRARRRPRRPSLMLPRAMLL